MPLKLQPPLAGGIAMDIASSETLFCDGLFDVFENRETPLTFSAKPNAFWTLFWSHFATLAACE
jgi:hypothetical protein